MNHFKSNPFKFFSNVLNKFVDFLQFNTNTQTTFINKNETHILNEKRISPRF